MGNPGSESHTQTGAVKPLRSGKEIFVAVLLLIVGLIYCLLFIQSIISSHSRSSTVSAEVISINRSELFSDLKTIVTIVCTITGGIGILLMRKTGWIFGLAQVLILLMISSAGWKQLIHFDEFGFSFFLVLAATLLLIIALVFLNMNGTRKKFGIRPRNYLYVLGLTALLFLIFFVLQ